MEKVNKAISQVKTNKWIHYAIIVIIGIILSIPLTQISIRDTHDGSLHLLRIMGTINDFKIGQIPPIVAPYYCNGGGYAMNLFYNPLVTYIPLLIKLIVPTYALALKIFAGICIVLSGIAMYHFTLHITKNRAMALFSAIIYLISPYKLGDVYRRYAIGEFASFIFIPILFTGLYNLLEEDGKKHYYIAIGAIGLLLTHTVTTFYMAIFSAVYVLFKITKLKDKEAIKKICINCIFIILICLFFIAPMFEAKTKAEYTIFDSEIMSTNGQYVFANTLKIGQLFNDKVTKFEDTVFSIGIPIFIFLVFTIFTYRKVDKRYKDFYTTAIFFSIISLFLCTKYCPWSIFPDFLCKLQYPWRMLGFFNFFSSFIVGINIYIIFKYLFNKDITRIILLTIIMILMMVYTLPIVLQFKTDDMERDAKYLNRIETQHYYISHFAINRDYLPTKALNLQRTYLQSRKYNKIYVLEGSANVSNEKVKDLTFVADIINCSDGAFLEFPFFYYPGYKIVLEENESRQKLEPQESKNGFLGVKMDKGATNATIKVEFVGTTITYISYVISAIALIAFVIYIVKFQAYERNKNEKEETSEKTNKEL